jgi:hypothetical protein
MIDDQERHGMQPTVRNRYIAAASSIPIQSLFNVNTVRSGSDWTTANFIQAAIYFSRQENGIDGPAMSVELPATRLLIVSS